MAQTKDDPEADQGLGVQSAFLREELVLQGSDPYGRIHLHLRTEYGPASGYRCVACGGPGFAWSWNRTGPSRTQKRGGGVLTFGLDPATYSPRCASCASAMDAPLGRSGHRHVVVYKDAWRVEMQVEGARLQCGVYEDVEVAAEVARQLRLRLGRPREGDEKQIASDVDLAPVDRAFERFASNCGECWGIAA